MTSERRHGLWWDTWRNSQGQPGAVPAFEGRFVRYFPATEHSYPDSAIHALATAMTAPLEDPAVAETEVDAEENRGTEQEPGIPSGYTYIGQFIDHDLTLDPTSNLRGHPLSATDLQDLVNYRTPRLDLDCLYGRGPADQPYLYAKDGLNLELGGVLTGNPHDHHARDVPRGPNGRALIGDPRNDENRIVAQLQATMLRFHNRMVQLMGEAAAGQKVQLEQIQDSVRWHYQWAVVHDFLPTIIQRDVLAQVFLQRTDDPDTTNDHPTFGIPYLADRVAQGATPLLPLMPVEFSVAAYRFGHSMIRPIYRLNSTIERRQIFAGDADPAGSLGGMRPIPSDWALDWQYFLDIDQGHAHPQAGNDPLPRTPQPSYKIDTSLVNPLAKLSELIAAKPRSLPERNLLRGNVFGLPSGEQVAHALGVPPLRPDQILIGKATGDATERAPITTIAGGAFDGVTPLWTYVLAEAWATSWTTYQHIPDPAQRPTKLGPVGGHLVAETIAALLVSDPHSYLNATTPFRPDARLRRNNRFGFPELIKAALSR